jgi:hypothetical protein
MNNNSRLYYHTWYPEIYQEFREHAIEKLQEHDLSDVTYDEFDAHHKCFNEDYYVIYYSVAEDWLLKHHLNVLQAINYIRQMEKDYFGEITYIWEDLNYMKIVNLFMYYFAMEHEYELESLFAQVKHGLITD